MGFLQAITRGIPIGYSQNSLLSGTGNLDLNNRDSFRQSREFWLPPPRCSEGQKVKAKNNRRLICAAGALPEGQYLLTLRFPTFQKARLLGEPDG
jgi:hypothetical protein